jgi:perosamine synthetase
MIPLTIPTINKDMESAIIDSINNETMVGGESVLKFEEEFARFIGTDFAVTVNSGSSALLLTFYAMKINAGDGVISPSATFVSTINGATILGGRPLFCEIGNDYVISIQSFREISQRNKCRFVIPVHLYGHPCNMNDIMIEAKENGIRVIEDAAQAHGAKYKNKKVGSFGDAGIFSFYPTKNMTVGGDGGMITTNSKHIRDSVIKMRDVGRKTKYTHDEVGYTLRLNSVNAAVGRVQLKNLERWNEERRKRAQIYHNQLADLDDLILPPLSQNGFESVFHMYVIRTQYRNLLGAWLFLNKISSAVHYPMPVHRQPAYRGYGHDTSLHFTDEWSNTVLSIPIYPYLSIEDQSIVIQNIHRFFDERLYNSDKVKNVELEWSKKLI